MTDVLKKLREIEIIKPSDHVVRQLKELLVSGELKPGDVLPSERELAETFNIGRSYVREAFKKMELYGIFTSMPGKGTVVNEISFQCFSDFLGNIIQFGVHDVVELSEVRRALEPNIAFKAATDATDEEIADIDALLKMLRQDLKRGVVDSVKTGQFHLKLAKASHNRFFATTMGIIIPDLARMISDLHVNRERRGHDSQEEHEAIFDAIKRHQPEEARKRMQKHMDNTDKQLAYCMDSMHWR